MRGFGLSELGIAGPAPERVIGLGLERWFAAAGHPVRLDMARSGAAASDVVVTHGAIEALLLACGTAIGERQVVAVASPAYEGMFLAVEAMGGSAQPVPVWKPGMPRLDLCPLAHLDLRKYAAVMVNSPHNPTGLRADALELDYLAYRCLRAGATLIVDEVSIGTLDPGAVSFRSSRAGESEAVMLIGDVSKAFGLGGLRVGWCATTCPRRRQRLVTLRDVTSLGNSAPSQYLAALALENRARLSVSEMAQANRDRLGVWLASMPGSSWIAPTDGLVAFPGLALPLPSLAFAERLRAKRRVSVTPGGFFGHDGHLRVGLGLLEGAFAEGLARVAEAMHEGSR